MPSDTNPSLIPPELLRAIEAIIDRKLAEHWQQEFEEIKQFLTRTVQEAVAQTAARATATDSPARRVSDLPPLDGKAAEVFEQLKAIKGTDAAARRQVQTKLAELKGEPISEALATALKQIASERDWSFVCPACGAAASILWIRKEDCSEGGYIQFSHPEPPKPQVKHAGSTTLPPVQFVPRVDRRRKRARR
jgi:hypothetical protein